MRYPATQKLETRTRIVKAASRGFREHGLAGLSVATVMAELGLTHGGFYAHFADKEALIVAAAHRAFADAWKTVDRAGLRDPYATAGAIAQAYLTVAHRDGRARGCLIAALGSELVRSSPRIRRAVAHDIVARLTRLSAHMPGRTDRRRRDAATLLIATLVGTLLLARLLPEAEGRRSLVFTRRVIGRVAARDRATSSSAGPSSARRAPAARPSS